MQDKLRETSLGMLVRLKEFGNLRFITLRKDYCSNNDGGFGRKGLI